jgi:CxxC-x17-CxxC domain-containing protein
MAFNDRNNSRGNSSRGGFGGPKEMYKAICSDCGAETEVPFKPDPDRPVYCRDCLPKHRKPRENRY